MESCDVNAEIKVKCKIEINGEIGYPFRSKILIFEITNLRICNNESNIKYIITNLRIYNI